MTLGGTLLNIKPIVIKEIRQIRRDKRTLGILLFVPAFMLVMFGYALSFDVKHLSLLIYDEDRSKLSRDLIASFTNTEYFDFEYMEDDYSRIGQYLDKGRVQVALVIDDEFSDNLKSGKPSRVQLLIDGTNPTTASAATGYSMAIVRDFSEEIILGVLMRKGGQELAVPIDYRPRVLFNPELKSARFLVPGLIAFILMVTAVISTSLSIVREKERGTMEQLTVSPVRPFELIAGKTIPYIAVSLAATAMILALGWLLFGVGVRGSYLDLTLVTLLYLVCSLGLGLLISSIAHSQQIAFMIAVTVTMLPIFLLSGFVFPIRNMPLFVQVITYLVPARYFMVALRAIVLKGVGIAAFWDQLIYLSVFTVVTLAVSSRRLKMQLVGSGNRRTKSTLEE